MKLTEVQGFDLNIPTKKEEADEGCKEGHCSGIDGKEDSEGSPDSVGGGGITPSSESSIFPRSRRVSTTVPFGDDTVRPALDETRKHDQSQNQSNNLGASDKVSVPCTAINPSYLAANHSSPSAFVLDDRRIRGGTRPASLLRARSASDRLNPPFNVKISGESNDRERGSCDEGTNQKRTVALWPSRSLRTIATIYVISVMFCTVAVGYLLQLAFIAATRLFTSHSRSWRQRWCASILHKMAILGGITLNPLWKVVTIRPLAFPSEQHDEEAASPSGDNDTNYNKKQRKMAARSSTRETLRRKKVIFLCNHLSNADIWVTAYADECVVPSDAAWIGKASIFSIPIGGWAVENSGHLKVQFTSEKNGWGVKKGTTSTLLAEAKEYLNSRRALIIYPEGARNPHPEGPVKEFKLGFFSLCVEMAAEYFASCAQIGENGDEKVSVSSPSLCDYIDDDDLITIVPVALSGPEILWSLKSPLLDAGKAYVSFGDPLTPKKGETAEQLRDRVYAIIEDLRNKHPDRK